MFKINKKNGKTEIIDISDNLKAEAFVQKLRSHEYQQTISGISVLRECGGKTKCPVCNRAKLRCDFCGELLQEHSCKTTAQYSITRPVEFRNILYIPEHISPDKSKKNNGGERITVLVDGIKLTLMVHNNQPACRLTLAKPGNIRYNPL